MVLYILWLFCNYQFAFLIPSSFSPSLPPSPNWQLPTHSFLWRKYPKARDTGMHLGLSNGRMSGDEFIWQAIAYLSDLDFKFPKKITPISAVPRHLFIQTAMLLPASFHRTGWLCWGSFPEAGMTGSSLPASPWEPFNSIFTRKENKGQGCCNPPRPEKYWGSSDKCLECRHMLVGGRVRGENAK